MKSKMSAGGKLFNILDDLFDIPREEEKPQMTEEELIDDFEKYIGA